MRKLQAEQRVITGKVDLTLEMPQTKNAFLADRPINGIMKIEWSLESEDQLDLLQPTRITIDFDRIMLTAVYVRRQLSTQS